MPIHNRIRIRTGVCLGALRGEHSLKVARSARAVQRLPLSKYANRSIFHLSHCCQAT